MKTTDEIMGLVERHVKACVLVRQDPVYETQVALTGEKLRIAIDDLQLSRRDEIAMRMPIPEGGLSTGEIHALTGAEVFVETPYAEAICQSAQAEAKLRYIRADAMLAARGEA